MSAATTQDLLHRHQWMLLPSKGLEIANPNIERQEEDSREPEDSDFIELDSSTSEVDDQETNASSDDEEGSQRFEYDFHSIAGNLRNLRQGNNGF
eukprot:CAMPEP_0170495626 /NCGR_PEP_ID=MMETSP0208-20121228/17643_1 /TAXON_ID=197538 /ORGANISM="Strombidium inclinatum, Strain S3" /LENGTH=94 /DNA_ID=CAMNT_0010771923 /DNA_START=23 /DNA_END=307 /DNA_ORIENTATION=+